jgi:SAM-dependent methyltransferase/predicted Ser/Thr protein kinase
VEREGTLKVVRFSAADRRRLTRRLTRFVLSMSASLLPVWLTYTVVLFILDSMRASVTAFVIVRALAIGGSVALFSLLGCVCTRYMIWRTRPGLGRYVLAGLWLIAVSLAWWNVAQSVLRLAGLAATDAAYGLLAHGWLSVAFIWTLVLANYGIRKHVALRRRRAYEMQPKALAAGDRLDAYEMIAGLNGVRQAYEVSRRQGQGSLELLQHELNLLADTRYLSPMPLPVALEFLRREIGLRRDAEEGPARIHMQSAYSFPADMVVEPAVLCAAGRFAVEYAVHRGKREIELRVIFQDRPVPCIEIQTNIGDSDLRFVVDRQSSAEGAKDRLIEMLNRFGPKGSVFGSGQDSDGRLLFRISVRQQSAGETVWEDVEARLGATAHLVESCDRSKGNNRVYRNGDLIYKVQLIDRHSPKPLTLAEEYSVLQRLEGIEGVPRSPEYREYADFAVLSYRRVRGIAIDEYLRECTFERRVQFRCIAELSALLNRLHRRGVQHRDLRPSNVLVSEGGRIQLIDFDQAIVGGYEAKEVDVQGKGHGVIPAGFSVRKLIDYLGVREEHEAIVRELRSAWRIGGRSKANSPRRSIAYYGWVFGDVELPGERDWFSRWDLLQKAVGHFLRGARVLDLGCNLGLVATHCRLYGAEHVTAVDFDEDILVAGRSLARAAGVDVDFVRGDLNSHAFVDSLLRRQYDLVIALSVVHWLENRNEVVRILASAPRVLFEGHDPPSAEIDWLRGLGFDDVQLIGYSERLRGVYLGLREGAGRLMIPSFPTHVPKGLVEKDGS